MKTTIIVTSLLLAGIGASAQEIVNYVPRERLGTAMESGAEKQLRWRDRVLAAMRTIEAMGLYAVVAQPLPHQIQLADRTAQIEPQSR